jgi:hypothetical protein
LISSLALFLDEFFNGRVFEHIGVSIFTQRTQDRPLDSFYKQFCSHITMRKGFFNQAGIALVGESFLPQDVSQKTTESRLACAVSGHVAFVIFAFRFFRPNDV